MRDLPPLQAILLLIVLGIVGYAGSQYIDMGDPVSPQTLTNESASHDHSVEAEIELTFSSPPLSYRLIKPSTTGGKDLVVLQSSPPIENPSYGSVKLTAHQVSTYWLDVRWSGDPKENSNHFVQINISPSHGKSQSYAFFTSSMEMNETFEYSTGEGHHE